MTRYIVRWEMIYEDMDNEFEAVASAYGNLAEIVHDPSIGANYVSVINPDIPNCHTTVPLDEALETWEIIRND